MMKAFLASAAIALAATRSMAKRKRADACAGT
jgi:hypothetical protein